MHTLQFHQIISSRISSALCNWCTDLLWAVFTFAAIWSTSPTSICVRIFSSINFTTESAEYVGCVLCVGWKIHDRLIWDLWELCRLTIYRGSEISFPYIRMWTEYPRSAVHSCHTMIRFASFGQVGNSPSLNLNILSMLGAWPVNASYGVIVVPYVGLIWVSKDNNDITLQNTILHQSEYFLVEPLLSVMVHE